MLTEFFTRTKSEKYTLQARNRLRSKGGLIPQEKKKLERLEREAKIVSTKLLKRRIAGVLAPLALAVVATALTTPMFFSDKRQGVSDWVKVEDGRFIGFDRVQQAIAAVVEWDKRYRCGREITIRELKYPTKQDLGGGRIATILEEAGAGYIELGPKGDVRNIILHAMTHACKPDKPTLLPDPLPFADGTISGYHGFTVLAKAKDGRDINFTLIEEAMAEYNASVFSGYIIESDRYFALGSLARRDFPFDRFPGIGEGFRTNDVPALIRARFNLSKPVPLTTNHHTILMDQYQQAWVTDLK